MKKIRFNVVTAFCLTGMLIHTSCDKFFDINTDEIILNENHYQNTSEVYAGLLGIASAFQQCAADYIVLSELRGDLVKPTANAPMDFWEAFRYRDSPENELVNPERFYRIIYNSNDFLRGIVDFNKKNPNALAPTLYKGVISAAITFRTWAYLAIGKIYGEAVYYDYALADNTDLSGQCLLSLDELINELIFFMQNGVDGIDAWNPLAWSELMGTDATDWYYVTVNPDMLMCELQLWNNNPWDAAQFALNAIYSGVDASGKADLQKYKLGTAFSGGSWARMFSDAYSTIGNEAFTAIPFEPNNLQVNKLGNYFSPYHNNYLQSTLYGFISGARRSYPADLNSINPYIIGRYTNDRERVDDCHIFIYRAGEAWLMLAEALVGTGDIALADSILNNGLSRSWDGSKFKAPFDVPLYRSDLQGNLGVRGRVGAPPNYLRDYVVDSLFTDETVLLDCKTFVMDSLIAEEVGQELAFEGKRWYALVRMARNLRKPEFLADVVVRKFDYSQMELYRIWLMEPRNWFVKYDHLNMASDR